MNFSVPAILSGAPVLAQIFKTRIQAVMSFSCLCIFQPHLQAVGFLDANHIHDKVMGGLELESLESAL